MSSLIKKAVISEKSFVNAAENKFTFIVDKKADKDSIAYECEKLFGVHVIDVNTTNYEGKVKMTRRNQGKRSDFKKAIITLKAGQKIDLFELEQPEEKKEGKKSSKKEEKEKVENTDVKTTIKKKGKTAE